MFHSQRNQIAERVLRVRKPGRRKKKKLEEREEKGIKYRVGAKISLQW